MPLNYKTTIQPNYVGEASDLADAFLKYIEVSNKSRMMENAAEGEIIRHYLGLPKEERELFMRVAPPKKPGFLGLTTKVDEELKNKILNLPPPEEIAGWREESISKIKNIKEAAEQKSLLNKANSIINTMKNAYFLDLPKTITTSDGRTLNIREVLENQDSYRDVINSSPELRILSNDYNTKFGQTYSVSNIAKALQLMLNFGVTTDKYPIHKFDPETAESMFKVKDSPKSFDAQLGSAWSYWYARSKDPNLSEYERKQAEDEAMKIAGIKYDLNKEKKLDYYFEKVKSEIERNLAEAEKDLAHARSETEKRDAEKRLIEEKTNLLKAKANYLEEYLKNNKEDKKLNNIYKFTKLQLDTITRMTESLDWLLNNSKEEDYKKVRDNLMSMLNSLTELLSEEEPQTPQKDKTRDIKDKDKTGNQPGDEYDLDPKIIEYLLDDIEEK